jgi:multiple sugar transport system ATP-binding protein
MTMGSRVAVMKSGRLMQCASPQDLYQAPANVFVAGFMGSPKMNLFQSALTRDANGSATVSFGPHQLAIDTDTMAARPRLRSRPEGPLTVGIRPEALSLAPEADAAHAIDVTATVVEMLGSETLVHFVAPVEAASDADVRDTAQATDEEESILAGSGATVMCARLVPAVFLREGSPIRLRIDPSKLYFFDENGDAVT